METVSVVVPVMNEVDTIEALADQVIETFTEKLSDSHQLLEIIFVDDGSTDGTWPAVIAYSEKNGIVSGVKFRRNFGKAAGLQQGFDLAKGEIIITMDGDLQDDPAEIPRFLNKLAEGLDVVSGWKKKRHDPLGKTLPSKLFNAVTSFVSGVPIHDFNCGFKAYRREVFSEIYLYGELHRYIPALAHASGFRVDEIVVNHHPRRFGQSKYGFERLLKGFLDLLTVVTITRFNTRPGHLFGGLGALSGAIGGSLLTYLSIIWLLGQPIGGRPLLIISVLFIIVGIQFILFGMIAELIVNLWRRDQDRNLAVAYTPNLTLDARSETEKL